MRVSPISARMILADLSRYGNDETVLLEVTLGAYRALLRDHVELCDRVKELEERLAASLRRPAS
jgi:hypothetical protein